MNRTLCIIPSGLLEVNNKPWALVLRSHDLGGVDYQTLAYFDDGIVKEVIEAGRVTYLYGEPDWEDRAKKRTLKKVRVMREEADKIEVSVNGISS